MISTASLPGIFFASRGVPVVAATPWQGSPHRWILSG